jgi:hypothetical protein
MWISSLMTVSTRWTAYQRVDLRMQRASYNASRLDLLLLDQGRDIPSRLLA